MNVGLGPSTQPQQLEAPSQPSLRTAYVVGVDGGALCSSVLDPARVSRRNSGGFHAQTPRLTARLEIRIEEIERDAHGALRLETKTEQVAVADDTVTVREATRRDPNPCPRFLLQSVHAVVHFRIREGAETKRQMVRRGIEACRTARC